LSLSKVELKVGREEDAELWDRLVESSPHGTIFHTWKWLKIAEKHTNSRLYPLIGYKGTEPVGIFPLFFQRKTFLKMVFSPPPHTAIPYLGPVLVNYDKLKQHKKENSFLEFQREVDRFLKDKLRAEYVYISLPPGLSEPRPFKWTGYEVEPAYGYLNDLSNGIDNLWKNFEKKLRGDIERGKRRGITVEEGDKEEVGIIYDLLLDRYAEQNKIVTVPKEYLFDVYDSFFQNIKVFVAKYKGEIVSGLIDIHGTDIHNRDRAATWIGNPRPKFKISPSPNDLLTWEAMKYACEHGFKYYETIGTAGDERLHNYYSKFNPELLVRFSMRKYSSFIPKLMEMAYIKTKPVYWRIKFIKQKKHSERDSNGLCR